MNGPRPLFITGGSGFVGSRLLSEFAAAQREAITCLARDPAALAARGSWRTGWTPVRGDVRDPHSYRSYLAEGSIVLHLAAITGKARRSDFEHVNVDGTRQLALAARERSVAHLIFVSSIAAGYGDQWQAHYAHSKAAAEEAVRESGVPHTIVRPTMVFGPGSPNQRAIERAALLPIPVIFGAGRTRVQPIHVDDLVRILVDSVTRLAARHHEAGGGELIEVGGPEVLTMAELYARVRRARGRRRCAPLRLPLHTTRRTLAALEPIAFPILPFTAGQLSVFANDSTARRTPVDASTDTMRDVVAMLGRHDH